ncbi:MAG: zinc ribbon domain-containing protein [Pyrinomonadaceae bacterium]
MSEIAIQTTVCKECGADVRDESLFCYGCGKAVGEDSNIEESKPSKGEIAHDSSEIVKQLGFRPPLRSAASLRKQRRAFNRQPVEVSWEPRTDSPIAFVISTIVLVIAALVFLLLALYLR